MKYLIREKCKNPQYPTVEYRSYSKVGTYNHKYTLPYLKKNKQTNFILVLNRNVMNENQKNMHD